MKLHLASACFICQICQICQILLVSNLTALMMVFASSSKIFIAARSHEDRKHKRFDRLDSVEQTVSSNSELFRSTYVESSSSRFFRARENPQLEVDCPFSMITMPALRSSTLLKYSTGTNPFSLPSLKMTPFALLQNLIPPSSAALMSM